MSYLAHAQAVADLDDLVMTHELASRPARAPDLAAENRALAGLAQELALHPEGGAGRVEEVLRALCRCGAAGTGLPDQHAGGVDWGAAGGEPVLLRNPARLFPSLRTAGPAPAEMLLPWGLDGEPAGMLWVADPERRFDLEDLRLLRSLSGFAGAARRLARSCSCGEQARGDIERDFARTKELHDAHLRLASETAQRSAAERELRESHAILDAAMHTEAVGLAFYTLDGSIIDCNQALERMSGYSRDELRTPVGWTKLAHRNLRERPSARWPNCARAGAPRPT